MLIEEILNYSTIKKYLNLLTLANKTIFLNVLKETAEIDGSQLEFCNNFIQHGDTTVLMHVIAVAIFTLYLAQHFEIEVEKQELIRGALLHDYFLYDWHEKKLKNKVHGFTHPRTAMNRASGDFDDLTEREKNMILRHMFPLTPIPPRYREGFLLCIADKHVAIQETIRGNMRNLPF